MKKQQNSECFPTTDIGLVAAALCKGYEFRGVDRENIEDDPVFIIGNLDDKFINDIYERYYRYDLKVDARTFLNFLKNTKKTYDFCG
jgi:hypothetical protein